jgi:hypothetical protein
MPALTESQPKSSVLESANWSEILDDLHAFKLKHAECLASFDPPTKNVIKKALDNMATPGSGSQPYIPFDLTRWEMAVSRFRPVNQERLVYAHATIHPDKHPDLVCDLRMLTSTEICSRCEREIFVGSLVHPLPGPDANHRRIMCIPCRQKMDAARQREEKRLAKQGDRGVSVAKSAGGK